jgi:L-lactate dehydrogenase complex protein LldF
MDLREVWRLLGIPVERWDSLREKVNDPNLRQALANATTRFAARREEALRGVGDFAKVQRRGREIKERALARAEELWASIEQQFTSRGGVVHHAATAEDARSIIKGISEDARVDLIV